AEIDSLELDIEEIIERGGGMFHAAHDLARLAEGQVEPLPAHRRHGAGLGCIRRDKGRVRQEARPFAAQADQIVTVGAVAMQEHNELLWRAASGRRKARSVKGERHLSGPCARDAEARLRSSDAYARKRNENPTAAIPGEWRIGGCPF